MVHVVELLAEQFFGLAEALRLLLEMLSVMAVLVGLGAALSHAVRRRIRRHPRHIGRPSHGARLTFASWLATALEFQLGADIVATTIAPTGEHLIQLGVVAVIRTFLNVFLAREIESEAAHEHSLRAHSVNPGSAHGATTLPP
ncbi:MAG: DUF1622 domain-containing protein [Prochlorococcaceae cyanobacterium]